MLTATCGSRVCLFAEYERFQLSLALQDARATLAQLKAEVIRTHCALL